MQSPNDKKAAFAEKGKSKSGAVSYLLSTWWRGPLVVVAFPTGSQTHAVQLEAPVEAGYTRLTACYLCWNWHTVD